MNLALQSGKRVIPAFLTKDALADALAALRSIQGVQFWGSSYESNMAMLTKALRTIVDQQARQSMLSDPDDPPKTYLWGGRASDAGRTLSARVEEIATGWYSVFGRADRPGDQRSPPPA